MNQSVDEYISDNDAKHDAMNLSVRNYETDPIKWPDEFQGRPHNMLNLGVHLFMITSFKPRNTSFNYYPMFCIPATHIFPSIERKQVLIPQLFLSEVTHDGNAATVANWRFGMSKLSYT